MVSVGVVGYGYWGPNLVRNFAETDGCAVAAVCDTDAGCMDGIRRRYPRIQTTTDWSELLANPAIDAVAIATPAGTHFLLAMAALRAGRHVLVEKPLAGTRDEALRLNEEAARRGLVLMVDHTFVYDGAVRKIHELIAAGALGKVYYYDSVRASLGVFQPDVDVLWDLAIHDLAILDRLLPVRPCAVTATGVKHFAGGPGDIACLTVFFEGGDLIAHLHVNRLSPVKVRRTLIGGSRQMIVYDDMEPSEKVKLYDRGIPETRDPASVYRLRVDNRAGDIYAPRLDVNEALRTMAGHFVECIERSQAPITDGPAGLRVVEALEAASQSLRDRGRLVELPAAGHSAAGT